MPNRLASRAAGAAQPLARVDGPTAGPGGLLLTVPRRHGGRGPVTELRCDAGTEHSILARP